MFTPSGVAGDPKIFWSFNETVHSRQNDFKAMSCILIAVGAGKYPFEISHLELAAVAVGPRHEASSSNFFGVLHFLTY